MESRRALRLLRLAKLNQDYAGWSPRSLRASRDETCQISVRMVSVLTVSALYSGKNPFKKAVFLGMNPAYK